MNDQFSAARVAEEILIALERRRTALVDDPAELPTQLDRALSTARDAYRESLLPATYFQALEAELRDGLPAQWLESASSFTALERRGFNSWRGGDIYARVTYVFAGLVVGGLCVALPFIPIWEKWFPFAVAFAAWWLPDLQAAWQRRRYGRHLGKIVQSFAARQAALEAKVTLQELAPAEPSENTPKS